MSCKVCSAAENLQVCLYCGHSYCSNHRGELGGAPACARCLKKEKQRAARPKVKAEATPKPAPQPEIQTQAAPAPLRPLPEPKGIKPLLWGLVAALPTAGYLYWFCGWLSDQHELPSWLSTAGPIAGGLVAFAGVWAIAKSR